MDFCYGYHNEIYIPLIVFLDVDPGLRKLRQALNRNYITASEYEAKKTLLKSFLANPKKTKEIKIDSTVGKWYFQGPKKWQPYNDDISNKLEEAFKKKTANRVELPSNRFVLLDKRLEKKSNSKDERLIQRYNLNDYHHLI